MQKILRRFQGIELSENLKIFFCYSYENCAIMEQTEMGGNK